MHGFVANPETANVDVARVLPQGAEVRRGIGSVRAGGLALPVANGGDNLGSQLIGGGEADGEDAFFIAQGLAEGVLRV
jgi:hypothetical protein